MPKGRNPEVDQYIAACPAEARAALAAIRAAILAAAPGSLERTDYFRMPGYSYPGFDYDGMFVWFSFKKPYVRLHTRPPVIEDHREKLAAYPKTKAIVSFPLREPPPIALVKKLTKASLAVMRSKAKRARG